ncbi:MULTISPECIES: ribulose-phosphate 3-epimerase [Mesotoga]|mgnify:CR=1 FL=1|jgi:ribulose-phosphate 3-epimerase|uniref:ribulose-phosphate 3-epimerase n=1 Tax=Mesotoga TaxID=1184396 RepID=UPI0002CA8316|nr:MULTISPECIES: ribulose-phosphate 3-epimerase [Mesotoga]MCP5457925.1 ribulose-phosphate 3-epimerase [Thermotogota bacterium]CCU85895.1 Ribulose-phosphate 3-epimerase [Mesotoga infera]MDK2943454.1 ribulose-phosphate 3-epimerase [Mesotoga sp.]RLL87713.1 ribulose-phosphate 3-epimerase [Mesotoga sp. H07pep.5.4]RLL91156.1 ribulose-phosphate 3-epimerase [Mesotoga sp. HF07.pep.5.2.highcov]
MARISPSILAADLTELAREVIRVRDADYLHIDVMDGMFVPNITFGVPIMEALGRLHHPPLDVHLMIEDPSRYVKEYAALGAKNLHVHVEGNYHLHRLLGQIRETGSRAFVVLNPSTPVSLLDEVLSCADGVLVMTVNPGYTGQEFIPEAAKKIDVLDRIRTERNLKFEIAVDGGVSLDNAQDLVNRGADILIMGAAVFRSENPSVVVRKIKELKR